MQMKGSLMFGFWALVLYLNAFVCIVRENALGAFVSGFISGIYFVVCLWSYLENAESVNKK